LWPKKEEKTYNIPESIMYTRGDFVFCSYLLENIMATLTKPNFLVKKGTKNIPKMPH
jgi:hypothetical protein